MAIGPDAVMVLGESLRDKNLDVRLTAVNALGRMLFTDYAFQFEVTSVLILVAMVGAVVLARRDGAARGKP